MGLIEQTKEHGRKHKQDRQPPDDLQTFLIETLFQKCRTAGWDVNIFFSSHPERDCRDKHENARYAEGPVRAKPFMLQQPGSK